MYKLFTDKSETFECDIKIEGATLSNSTARLVVETSDYSLMFNGSISSDGKCKVPIKKLKGLIDENNNEVFVFNGWTFSSSPAINPFDHPVYDIWLTKCY